MDVYGVSAPDLFRIDDLLDFSNDEIFSINSNSSSTTATPDSQHHHHHLHQPHSDNSSAATANYYDALLPNCSDDFTDNLCVPSDDVAELEWLSNFVEDSFSSFPTNSVTGTMNLSSNTTASFHGRSRSKRSRSTSSWTSSLQNPNTTTTTTMKNKEISVYTRERSSSMDDDVPRRCTHCASEKTPQWRTGPLGPKTLCNACGVRFKSGRLVPEYRPAASPTFVLTQHSNSHRKVMELRRQKEMIHQQPPPPTEEGMYGHHFRVC
ncbi:GATA transcription factor 4 [Nicotiana sylvestris]|uniref:GATA transcription factor n=2 Tax=Nicotiana TaxID=4085 RepID=A0A1S3Y4C9_TOBAC|nr:PREDICTED: GATA transcription factor 4 [Nicotiana sylvestris]XP_016447001.1 PREDICTED: GATA transcription factor 4-like [Nicotiana tabacum]